jgi:hypothetical protein
MEKKINIKKTTLLTDKNGMDKIRLEIDGPPQFPRNPSYKAYLDVNVAAGEGPAWLFQMFGLVADETIETG